MRRPAFLRERPAKNPHSETAGQRALRTWGPSISTARFVLWLLVCEAAIAGYAAYRTSDSSARVQGIVTATAILGAGAFAIGTALVTLWVSAPVRQRDEARVALATALAVPAEPDLHVVPLSINGERGKASHNTLITIDMTITNRQSDAVSLQFRLQVLRPDGSVFWVPRYTQPVPFAVLFHKVAHPIAIGPKHTEPDLEITFWLGDEEWDRLHEEFDFNGSPLRRLQTERLSLEIEDLASGGIRIEVLGKRPDLSSDEQGSQT